MENKDKVMSFRDAAVTVIERKKIYEDDELSHEQLIYNAGYNAGVLDLMAQIESDFVKKSKEFEEHLDKIVGLQDVIRQIRGNENSDDSDIEDYLGGND